MMRCAFMLAIIVSTSSLFITGSLVEARAEVTLAEKEAQVKAYIQGKVMPNLAEQEKNITPAMIQSWGTGSEKWELFRGGTVKDLMAAIVDDFKKVFQDFDGCQTKKHPHTFLVFLVNAVVAFGFEFMGIGGYGYFPLNETSGICVRINYEPLWDWDFDVATLTPYLYPVETVDASEQMYQSPYHLEVLVKIYLMLNRSLWDNLLTKTMAKASIGLVRAKTATLGGLDIAALKDIGKGIDTDGVNAGFDAIDAERDRNPDIIHTAPHLTHAYSRIFFNLFEPMTQGMRGIPHLFKMGYSGTDMPFWYGFSRFPVLSILASPGTAGVFMEPFGERICVRDNIAQGKTPKEFGLLAGMATADAESMRRKMCVSKVGERVLVTAPARQEIPDRTLQSVAKAMEMLVVAGGFGNFSNTGLTGDQQGMLGKAMGEMQGQMTDVFKDNMKDMKDTLKDSMGDVGGSYEKDGSSFDIKDIMGGLNLGGMGGGFTGHHTYRRELDRFRIIRDSTFRGENDRCDTLDNLAQENITYNKSNIKQARSGGLKALSRYVFFQGCWGYKGVSKSWWESGNIIGEIFTGFPGPESALGDELRIGLPGEKSS
jgi:hypothetical protein